MIAGRPSTDVNDFCGSVLAVMVSYNCSATSSNTGLSFQNSQDLRHSRLDFLVYDNSPVFTPALEQESLGLSASYIHDPTNPGVSKAYNQAAKVAKQMGKKWLLLLDQDTSFPVDALQVYAAAIARNPEEKMFAPLLKAGSVTVSPCTVYSGIGMPLRRQVQGRMTLRNRSILNSGMLVNLEAFEAIGGFNENIPLDFADHDFCRRFAKRYGSAYILDMVCQHGFSDRETSSLDKDLARFAFYCRGARNSVASVADVAGHSLAVLIRSMRLCRRHRTAQFWGIVRKEYLKG